MDYLSFRDWRSYHNYKQGPNAKDDPPWIQLKRSLLSEYEFTKLTAAERGQLLSLFLLAMQTGNRIPKDPIWIQQKCILSEPIDPSRFGHWLEIPYELRTETVRTPQSRGEESTGEESTSTADPSIDVPAVRVSRETPKRQMPGEDGEFLRAFDGHHRRVLGMPYLSQVARDRKCLKGPLKVYGRALLLEMSEAFWREVAKAQADRENHWTGRARPDVPGFVHSIPNLLRDYEFDNKAVSQ